MEEEDDDQDAVDEDDVVDNIVNIILSDDKCLELEEF